MYPEDHQIVHERVHRFIQFIAESPSETDEKLIAKLVATGIPEIDAELVLYLVPSAFSRAFLPRLGVDTTPSVLIVTDESGNDVEFDIWEQHYFVYAFALAEEIMERGYTEEVSKAVFQAITNRSAELDAVNSALNAGVDLKGCKLAPIRILHLKSDDLLRCCKEIKS